MTRSQRIAPVQQVLDNTESQHAKQVSAAQAAVVAAEAKLAELQRYHVEYVQSFGRQVASGATCHALQDFQSFLHRLSEAAKQQEHVVARTREELAAQTHHWQVAARRSRGLQTVVNGWRREEQKQVERSDQQQTDERALTMMRRAEREAL